MTKPANIEGIEAATKMAWSEWLKFFDSINAKNLSHPEIAKMTCKHLLALRPSMLTQVEAQAQGHSTEQNKKAGLSQESKGVLPQESVSGLPRASVEWWSQSVAVAYEQHIGRRQPGQRNDGTYEVAVSKTLAGTMDDAMRVWVNLIKGKTEFADISIEKQPTTSKTEKWRHWRVILSDGSHISVDTYNKPPDKAMLTITNTKLKNAETAARWRLFWKELLKNLSAK